MKRYILKQDEDSHWYLIPMECETDFETTCSEAYRNDEFDDFESKFGEMRINGPHDLSFTNPCDSEGNDLR